MDLLFHPVVIFVAVFVAAFFLFPFILPEKSEKHKRKVLERVSEEQELLTPEQAADADSSILREYRFSSSDTLEKLIRSIPGTERTHQLLLQSGSNIGLPTFLMLQLILMAFIFMIIMMTKLKAIPLLALLIAVGIGLWLPRKYLIRKVNKRNELFIDMFPDAVDMIVRSVRSGHPLNAALRMIAENMDPPISTEFKQLVDEIAYGRTLPEALHRMSQRIGEADLQFFVVVLSVQQETGGNLAEVLSNLSNIIRKRKQLRLKIKALTSEGRMTSWILGGLPVVVFLILWIMSPEYLDPLFTTLPGNFILALAGGMIALCFWIVNKMIDIDI